MLLTQIPHIDPEHYPLAPDDEMSRRIAEGYGIFDRDSFGTFIKHITGRNLVLDIGAHVGSWSIGFSKIFNSVISFEPQPVNREHLNSNILRANATNVTVYPYALVDKPRLSQAFTISAEGTTRNSGMAHLKPLKKGDRIKVDTRCLDDIDLPRPIDAIKIDVEGMELSVLRGAEELIRTFKPTLLIEINGFHENFGFSTEEIYAHMDRIGYRQAANVKKDFIFTAK